MSLSKSMCRSFNRNSLGTQQFLLLTQALLVFYSQKLWGLIFLLLEPWAQGPGVGLGPLTPVISLLNFYPPHMGVGQSIPRIPVCGPPTSLDGCGFFNSTLVRLPFHSISDGSE